MNTAATTVKPRIRRSGRYTFRVSSRTRANVMHTVDVLHLRCNCEAGQHATRCWHLTWALQAEQWLNRAAPDHTHAYAGARQ